MPRLRAMTPSGLVEVTRFRALHFNALRLIRTLKVLDNGVLRTVGSFIQPLSVSISPATASGRRATSGEATTNTVTASVSGGQGPYTYSWVRVSNDNPGVPIATNPSGATTAFRGYPDGDAVFQVNVTDALGNTASGQVAVTFISFA
ncbi:PKD domain-containing protein [Sphingobium olei]|uniref:Ig-like domain-containing protein n=1 Tax=Sphingobium olei TaxID=420955 RepID=A0ABW3NZM4_9SPHN